MNDLLTTVDWSRWQFALTAIYHWLFVPLTLGLAVIVGIMESIYVKTGDDKWLKTTKFWMTLFGINFAIGVATGLILEFEFGTNWSNYSWFVGDIFGAPLAIEGLLAFFMEATFVAVMFFGWGKVSKGFHLASTWLTAIGASISALWILVANAWMQYPVGMEFDPAQMRNVMDNFWALFSGIAVNKFFHAVLSGWALAGVFVIAVSCWFLLKKKNTDFAIRSIKVGAWTGLVGLLLTMYTGDGSAVQVTRHQPMKLAAMEGLYNGSTSQSLVAVGLVNPDKQWNNDEDPYLFNIDLPYGLSILARHDANAFVPGINDIIAGVDINEQGDTINTVSYAGIAPPLRHRPEGRRRGCHGEGPRRHDEGLPVLRLRIFRLRGPGHSPRCPHLLLLSRDGDSGFLSHTLLPRGALRRLPQTVAATREVAAMDRHDNASARLPLLAGRMDSCRSGAAALDSAGPPPHLCRHLRHPLGICNHHFLDFRRHLHHASNSRGEHNVPLHLPERKNTARLTH